MAKKKNNVKDFIEEKSAKRPMNVKINVSLFQRANQIRKLNRHKWVQIFDASLKNYVEKFQVQK